MAPAPYAPSTSSLSGVGLPLILAICLTAVVGVHSVGASSHGRVGQPIRLVVQIQFVLQPIGRLADRSLGYRVRMLQPIGRLADRGLSRYGWSILGYGGRVLDRSHRRIGAAGWEGNGIGGPWLIVERTDRVRLAGR